jgi:hypothetical protein
LKTAFVQANDTVHPAGKSLVVRRDECSCALASNETKELGKDLVGGLLIKVARRLVGKDERRLVCKGAGDCNALLLAP